MLVNDPCTAHTPGCCDLPLRFKRNVMSPPPTIIVLSFPNDRADTRDFLDFKQRNRAFILFSTCFSHHYQILQPSTANRQSRWMVKAWNSPREGGMRNSFCIVVWEQRWRLSKLRTLTVSCQLFFESLIYLLKWVPTKMVWIRLPTSRGWIRTDGRKNQPQ